MEMGHTHQGSMPFVGEPSVLNTEDHGWTTHTRKHRMKDLGKKIFLGSPVLKKTLPVWLLLHTKGKTKALDGCWGGMQERS